MVGRRELIKRGAGAIAAAGIGAGIAQSDAVPVKAAIEAPGMGDPKHIVLIVLDRSGSMTGLKKPVTDGLNAFLDDQADKKNMFIGLVQFDTFKTKDGGYCEPIFEFTAAQLTPRLGPNDYQPRGGTPLLAAVAEGINKLEQIIRPIDRALLVVQTDGLEANSPPEITKAVIRQLIQAKTDEGNWTFAFLGADIDAWGEGGSLGVQAGSTLGYANTVVGTVVAYNTTSASTGNWYASTGGGLTTAAAATTPTNSNATFFVNVPNTSNTPTNYTGKKPWGSLTKVQQAHWLQGIKNNSASA